jgi:hypothetical protein
MATKHKSRRVRHSKSKQKFYQKYAPYLMILLAIIIASSIFAILYVRGGRTALEWWPFCSSGILSFAPNPAIPGETVTPSVSDICGNPAGKQVLIKQGSCRGNTVSSCIASGARECTGHSFMAPRTTGTFGYKACIDLNDNGVYNPYQGDEIYGALVVSRSSGCVHVPPTLTIEPDSASKARGETLWYEVRVANNDLGSCGESDFSLRYTCPSGLSCSFVPSSSFALKPRGYQENERGTMVYLSVSSYTAASNRRIVATAVNTDAPGSSSTAASWASFT